MLINHLIHHVATFKPGQSLCWEVSTPFVSPIRNAGCICIFCMLLLPTSPGYKFHSTVAFTLCHSRSYHQRRCFGTWGLVMSEQWLVNVIWCDLQNFLPRRYSSWKNYGSWWETPGLFWACSALNCHPMKPCHVLTYLTAYEIGPAFDFHYSQTI